MIRLTIKLIDINKSSRIVGSGIINIAIITITPIATRISLLLPTGFCLDIPAVSDKTISSCHDIFINHDTSFFFSAIW
jgi:hypothetical protein